MTSPEPTAVGLPEHYWRQARTLAAIAVAGKIGPLGPAFAGPVSDEIAGAVLDALDPIVRALLSAAREAGREEGRAEAAKEIERLRDEADSPHWETLDDAAKLARGEPL